MALRSFHRVSFNQRPATNKLLTFPKFHSYSTKMNSSTFSNQTNLTPLPVPSLNETAKKYLKSVEPLQSEYQHLETTRIVNEFISPSGLGPVLQSRLVDHAKNKINWLEDWWFKYGSFPLSFLIKLNLSLSFMA